MPQAIANPTTTRSTRPIGQPLSLHAPNPFEGDVMFVSIDLEKLGEFVPRDFYPMIGCITAIGTATLDSRDLRQTTPGVDAANWRDYITKKQIEVTDTCKFRSIWRKGKLNTLPYRPTPVNRADISSCLRTELKIYPIMDDEISSWSATSSHNT